MDGAQQAGLERFVVEADGGFERRYQVADHIFRRIVQQRRQAPSRRRGFSEVLDKRFHQHRMLRHREGPVAGRLAVPARQARQPVGDILDFDVERRGLQQIEPPAAEHPLPRTHRYSSVLSHCMIAPRR